MHHPISEHAVTMTPVGAPLDEIGPLHRTLAFLLGLLPFSSIAGTNIALLLFVLLWGADLFRKRTSLSLHRTPFDVVLITYFSLWVLAGVAGLSPYESIKKVAYFQHPLVFYLLLYSYGGRLIPFALYGIGSGAGLNILYGWGQFLLWDGVYNFRGGERPDWFLRLGANWQKYISLSPKDERIHGALHLMTYSELLLPPLFFMGARFLEKGKGFLFLSGFFLSGIALVLAGQRGPLLSAGMGLVLILAFHARGRRLLAPMLIIVAMVWIYPDSRMKMAKISTAQGIRENHRVALWRGGLYLFSRHPLIGVGPGQINRATDRYKDEPDFPPNPKGQAGDLHNYYLQRLVEMGIPGLIVSSWLLLVFIKIGYVFYRRRESVVVAFPGWAPETINALALSFFASFFSFFFVNITERAFDDAEVALAFWIMAAVSVWFVRQAGSVRSRV